MPSTYEPIASVTLSSTASSYTFSSIPNTYTDLVLHINGLMNSSAGIQIRVNGDTGTNYGRTYMAGASSLGAGSGRDSNDTWIGLSYWGATSGNRITGKINFMQYSNTAMNKTMIIRQDNPEGNGGNTDTISQIGVWRSTAAITSITILSGTFGIGSTFTLHGIKAA